MTVRPLCLSLALGLSALAPAAAAPSSGHAIAIGQLHSDAVQGREVVVEGVVSADFRDGLGGLFLQDAGDGDAATPDAILVLAGDVLAAAKAGERWRIGGTLVAQPDQPPALQPLRALRLGAAALPQPVILQAPPADWQALAGMRVRIDAPLTLNATDARYGETIASFDGRLWTPSERAAAGTPQMQAALADSARRRLLLDDGSDARNPPAIAYLPAGIPRGGSTARGVEGIVDRRHGHWRLLPTAPLQVQAAARPPAPQVAGNTRIAVFNLENLFNGDGKGGGFPTPRGARTRAGYDAQVAKLVATLAPLQADIAALMELENDGYGADSSLAQFVAALNAGGGDWRYVDAGRDPGDNPIRVGLIYRASRVTPVGKPATLDGGPFAEHSRAPLAQAFRRGDGGEAFVVAANHFKSKGCSEAAGADRDQGDGAGCWSATRTETARRLDAWLKSDPTGQGAARTLIVGDLNAYAMEAPLLALRDAGWVDAFAQAQVEQPYSYVYAGHSGRLDHALLSPALAGRLRGAAEWHSNADEADGEGYAGRDAAGPWRSSDHDPMLLGLDL